MQNAPNPNRQNGVYHTQNKKTHKNIKNNGGPTRRTSMQKRTSTAAYQRPYQNRAKQQVRKRNGAISGLAIGLVVLIFVSMALLVVRSVDWETVFSDKTRKPFSNPDNLVYGPELSETERDAFLTQYVTVHADDIYRGSCILVNVYTPYRFFEEEDPVLSIYQNKTVSYKVSSSSLKLQLEAIRALNDMMDAFYAETENRNVMVNSAYRTEKQQRETYAYYVQTNGQAYAEQYVQQPGYSEHHTGYAVDLAVYDEGDPDVEGDEAMWAFDGKDEYFWIDRNCTQYGYILRYSASKEDVTGISYESWHYRYVGIGNALAISNLGLSLEEYINYIKDYSYEGTRYYTTAANGDIYCLYYVPTEQTEGQQIPVPKNAKEYNISGNNIDGFIVSALVGNENT